ncbi:MAG: thioesterase [Anaerolineae bacterium]|nr:thioesterase [Anaerolineae bacterium]
MKNNRWLVCPQPNSSATARLFLFPYAGGAPSSFNKWAAEFPKDIEVSIAHYPGRGSRFNEPPIKELLVLVEEITNAIQPELGKPFFFFGHSLGAVLAFEVARRIRPQPQILFVSACGAPHVPNPNRPIYALSDSEFIKSLQELNGLPAEVVSNAELMELLIPALRADFEAVENYQYTSNDRRLECPIVAFGGSDDSHVDRARLDNWDHHTNGSFKSKIFQGDHFFINTTRQSVINSMIAEIGFHHAKK